MMTEEWLPNTASMESQIFQKRAVLEIGDERRKTIALTEKEKENPEAWIALGRACRRQNLFREAIEAYSLGIEANPFYALLYRHRGHAYLNTGRYAESVGDFEVAKRLDPSNFDNFYHQGIAFFMLGLFENSAQALREGLNVVSLEQDIVCTTDWLWRSLMRLGKKKEAAALLDTVRDDMKSDKALSYFKALKMYKGKIESEELLREKDTTSGFAVANYYYVTGKNDLGDRAVRTVLEYGAEKAWGSFGYQGCLVEKERRAL
jgi:tetratricopeptide (TPR) repeat protein